MATRIAESITQKLLTTSVIKEEDKELYSYGFFLLITRFFFFLITVFVGVLVGIPVESVLFYIVFVSLRGYAGGVHAKTETACTILTTLALTGSVLGIKVMEITNCSVISTLMLMCGSLVILLFSPLDTKEKPLTNQEKRYYRRVCYLLLALWLGMSVVAQIASLGMVFYSVTCGVFLEGMLLGIGKMCNAKE